MMQTEWRRESLEIAQEIRRHAEAKGITPVQFAFAWVLNNRLVTAAIAGPRTRSSSRTICRRWSTGSVATTRSWSTAWWRAAIPPRRASTIPPTRSRTPRLGRAGQLIIVRVLDPDEAARQQDQLIELLVDAVEGGASIGFVLPLERGEAAAYWQGVTAGLRAGRLALVAAFERDRLAGSVQLGLEPRANGRHRAEVMKLMVRRSHRRRGIGRSLLQAVCEFAQRSAARCCCSTCAPEIRRKPSTARAASCASAKCRAMRWTRTAAALRPAASIICSCTPARSPGVHDGRSGTAGRAVAAPRALLCRRAARGLPTGAQGAYPNGASARSRLTSPPTSKP